MTLTTGPMAADGRDLGHHDSAARSSARAFHGTIRVRVTRNIEEVEGVWRALSAGTIESPGQSYDFINLWVKYRGIGAADQRYVVGEVDGRAVALLPLHRKRLRGVTVLTWFPGAHAGCYTPVADLDRLASLGAQGRAALWRQMIAPLRDADLLYLRSMPRELDTHGALFDELGSNLETDTLYRAAFGSWAECDAQQRSRSRRKHDRQHSEKLAALGTVQFEEIADPDLAQEALGLLFHQRSERFRAQGIRDCFVEDGLTGFYHDALRSGSGIDVRLHALRLDGEIVAQRYNIVHGNRMFCLISSMSEDPRIQSGSPGKQCLLRVMQTVFDDGMSVFDMGAGYTDEKRHWCNVQITLRHHYVALTPLGMLAAAGHRALQRMRTMAKSNASIKSRLRALRQWSDGLRQKFAVR